MSSSVRNYLETKHAQLARATKDLNTVVGCCFSFLWVSIPYYHQKNFLQWNTNTEGNLYDQEGKLVSCKLSFYLKTEKPCVEVHEFPNIGFDHNVGWQRNKELASNSGKDEESQTKSKRSQIIKARQAINEDERIKNWREENKKKGRLLTSETNGNFSFLIFNLKTDYFFHMEAWKRNLQSLWTLLARSR